MDGWPTASLLFALSGGMFKGSGIGLSGEGALFHAELAALAANVEPDHPFVKPTRGYLP